MRVQNQEERPSSNLSERKTISLKKRTSTTSSENAQNHHLLNISEYELIDRLQVMRKQEQTFKTSVGFLQKWQKNQDQMLRLSLDATNKLIKIKSDKSCHLTSSDLNEFYRGVLCHWSYQLCEFLKVDREVVAIAFSYLDRLLNVYICDKKVCRLAILTCIYLANNILNRRKELPIENLPKFCRFEFSTATFCQMELVILQALSWKLHPPTVTCFIQHLCQFLPHSVRECVIMQSSFLVELSVHDYFFVSLKPSQIAYCAILNACSMCSFTDEVERVIAIHDISRILELDSYSDGVIQIQRKLHDLYKCSKQYKLDCSNDSAASDLEMDHSFLRMNDIGILKGFNDLALVTRAHSQRTVRVRF